MKYLLFIFCFFVISYTLLADSCYPRKSYYSQNKNYELRIIDTIIDTTSPYDTMIIPKTKEKFIYQKCRNDKYIWGLIDKTSDSLLYTLIKDNFLCKKVLVSNDGNYVVIIDDFVSRPYKSEEVLFFYEKGNCVKSYKLGELVSNLKNGSTTYGLHYHWCLRNLNINEESNFFELTTYELQMYQFSLNGGMLSKTLSKYITENTFYGYGKIISLGDGYYEITVKHKVYGILPENRKLKFHTNKKCWNNECFYNYHTVIIENGELIQPTEFYLDYVSFTSIYGSD